VDLRHGKVHATDCAECETREGRVDRIETRMELEGDLTDEQYTRLLEISEKCPIKKTLTSEVVIVAK
jgi:putative redox protein